MNNFELDFRYIKAFMVVAKHLNFSKAAKELNIAQSAVSRQVRLLEESLKQQLIVRSSKKVLLTNQGEDLLSAARLFENKAQSILQNPKEQTITIGILHGLLENWFLDVIRSFMNGHNKIKVESGYPKELKEGLLHGDYDLIFTTENIQNDLVSSLHTFDEDLVLIGPEDIDLKKCEKYPWIIYNDDDHLLKLTKKRPPKLTQVNSMTAIVKLVAKGCGIAVVPKHIIGKGHNFKVSKVQELPKSSIYIATLNFRSMPPRIKELIDCILAQV